MIIYRVTIGLYVICAVWFFSVCCQFISDVLDDMHYQSHRVPDAIVQTQRILLELRFGFSLVAMILIHLTLAIVRRGYLGLPLPAGSLKSPSSPPTVRPQPPVVVAPRL